LISKGGKRTITWFVLDIGPNLSEPGLSRQTGRY
jgi:hypothetical protein